MTDSAKPRPTRAFTKCSIRWRKAALGIVLAPLLLLSAGQSSLTCEKTGDTSLQILEVELLGTNQITFDTTLRRYSVWPAPPATTFRLRALSTNPAADVSYNMLGTGAQLGIGGGVAVLDTPPERTPLFVWVRAPGGKIGSYKVTFAPECLQGDACDYGGVPGVCFAGTCETDPTTDGTLLVNGDFNLCAELTSPSVSSTYAERGATIGVFAQVDDAEGDPVDYLWTATGGSFDDPSAPLATYTCDDPGSQVISLGVSDDGFNRCIEEWTTIVVCGDVYLCAGIDCNDGDICTDDSCDPATGLCDHVPTTNTSAELCDGLDNDCDGDVDEDFNLGAACTAGAGECLVNGTLVCSPDGTASECSAVAGTPPEPVEVSCNDGLDNDCDGASDISDSDCPQVECPCFNADELVYNRPYDECWSWDAVATHGPGVDLYRNNTPISGKTGYMYVRQSPSTGLGCNFVACGLNPPGAGLHGAGPPGTEWWCNYSRSAYETRTPPEMTLEQWNACLALVEAEVVNAGLTCFDCNQWQDCDQSAGPNQCINNVCQY